MFNQLDSLRIDCSKRHVVVLDIDGCLIDSSARLPHLLAGDRKIYDALHPMDKTIPAGVLIYRMLLASNYHCVFVTSRCENAREYTLDQLQTALAVDRQSINLLMRPMGENDTDDAVLKPRLLKEADYDLSEIILAIEDRTATVEMWRANGVNCWQPEPAGNYHVVVNN